MEFQAPLRSSVRVSSTHSRSVTRRYMRTRPYSIPRRCSLDLLTRSISPTELRTTPVRSTVILLGLKVSRLLSCAHTLSKLALEWDLRNNDQRAMEIVTNSFCAVHSLIIRLAGVLLTLSLGWWCYGRRDLVHHRWESSCDVWRDDG